MRGNPKRRDNRGESINPSSQGSGSILQEKPVFSLIYLQSAYDLDKCTQEERIPSVITPDVKILAFRFCAMVGFRDGVIFHVVWLDRGFTLYDHG